MLQWLYPIWSIWSERDYEDMEKRYQEVRKQEFLNMPFSPDTQYYQLALLQEQAAELIKSWPMYNMHAPAKCELPVHPSKIPFVDMIEGYRVAEVDAKNSPAISKLHTSGQRKISLNMLLNPRPKWACLEYMQREVKDLQIQFAMNCQVFLTQLTQFVVPNKEDLCGHVDFVQHWVKQLYTYKDMVEHEVNFVLQFLLQMLDTSICLIGIQPDQDALPHFFPVNYPFLQEPRDAEEYTEIADKLKVWRVKFKMNYDLMEDMFTSMDKEFDDQQLTPLQLKDLMINVHSTFDRWTELLRQLFKHCNELLQLNIVASNTVQHKNKASTVEKEIVEILLEQRVHHQKPLQSGWIATAEHCIELAKVRLTVVTEGKF